MNQIIKCFENKAGLLLVISQSLTV